MVHTFVTGLAAENIYLYYDEETKDAVLIDPGEQIQALDKMIEDKGLNLQGILLTHGHADHIIGVPYYRDKYNLKVYAFRDEQDILEDKNKNLSAFMGPATEINDVIYFNDGDELKFGSLSFKVYHTPGHTKGSVVFETPVGLFSGDTLFRLGIGRYDLYSGNFAQIKNSIEEVIYKLKDQTVYPGHGPQTSLAFERRHNPFFKG